MFYIIISIIALAAGAVAAGGGGGGGGGGGSSSSSGPAMASGVIDHDPYASASLISNYKTTEYNNRYSLASIRAAEAYALLDENDKPVAGDGVKIAISDTGINASHVEISSNYDSTNSNNNNGGDLDGHGSNVASIAAGVKSAGVVSCSFGGVVRDCNTHGVAFNSGIVSVKVIDSDDSAGDIWISWIENNGDTANTKVINMSWAYSSGGSSIFDEVGGSTYTSIKNSLTSEFQSATDLDMVMTVAAGNDASTNRVSMPAVFAGDAVVDGKMIAVAAVDSNNAIASFSNRCAQVKDYCLAAPGVSVIGAYTGSDYAIYSGTSQAAPHVAGAAAVLRAAWPALTAAQTVQILLDSALDLGAVGVDDIYGHGLLNLEEAIHAQGLNHIPSSNSLDSTGYDAQNSVFVTSSIFGDSYQKNIAPILKNAVFFDKYGRDYKANLDQKISTTISSAYNLDNILFNNYRFVALPLSNNLQMKFIARNFSSDSISGTVKTNPFGLKYLTVDNSKTDPTQINSSDVAFSYSKDFNKDLKIGFAKNDFNSDFAIDNPIRNYNFISYNNFSSGPYQKISWSNSGLSSNKLFISQNINYKLQSNFSFTNFNNDKSRIFDSGLNYKLNDKTTLGLSYGNFKEFDDQFLGSKSSGAFSLGSNVSTNYFKINSIRKLTKDWQLIASYTEGKTNIAGNKIGIFRDFKDVRSRAIDIGILGDNIFGGKFGIIYSEPLRVYKGTTNIDIPISRDLDGNVQRLVASNVSLKPDGKERDLEFSYRFDLKSNANLSLNAIIQNDPGNIKSANQEYIWLARYGLKF